MVTCTVKQPIVVLRGIDRSKYSGDPKMKEIGKYYDYISEKRLPEILKLYYNSLGPEKISMVELIFDTVAHMVDYFPYETFVYSKKAKDGYLYVNRFIKDSCCFNNQILYIINSDTINSEKLMYKLFALKRKKVDSIIVNDDKIITIKTK